MRSLVMPIILALLLAACNSPTEQKSAASTTPAATPPAGPAATTPAEKPAEVAAAPVALPPEGTCGDQSALPADQRLANTPRWTTASEVDNFGYEVFRGDTEQGEFKKLGAAPLLGAGTTDETKKYEFRDDTIDPCKEYWYYVESISTSGAREKFTPVFKAGAKRRAVGSATK